MLPQQLLHLRQTQLRGGNVLLSAMVFVQPFGEVRRLAVEEGQVQTATERWQDVIRVFVKVFTHGFKAFIGAAQVAHAVMFSNKRGEQLVFDVGVEIPQAAMQFTLSEQLRAVFGDAV